MEKRVGMRDGEERSDEQKVVSYSATQYTVVATLLPSFAPHSDSPHDEVFVAGCHTDGVNQAHALAASLWDVLVLHLLREAEPVALVVVSPALRRPKRYDGENG